MLNFHIESDPASIQGKILAGQNITKEKPPITNFICPILLYGNHAATGIFLSKTHVLTVAKFLLIKNNFKFSKVEKEYLLVAMIYSEDDRETIQVEDFHIHDDFDPRSLEQQHDVAILIVSILFHKKNT